MHPVSVEVSLKITPGDPIELDELHETLKTRFPEDSLITKDDASGVVHIEMAMESEVIADG